MTEVLRGPALRRGLLGAMAAFVALFGTAAAASAATMTYDAATDTLIYTADAGNQYVTFSETDSDTVVVFSDEPVAGAPANCTDDDDPDAGQAFTCDGVAAVRASTGADDDFIDGRNLETIELFADGGDGDDVARGGSASDNLLGGAGFDNLYGDFDGSEPEGADSDDVVDGGPGDDWIAGGGGEDVVNGGDGDDARVSGGPGNDTVDGGAGNESGYSNYWGVDRAVQGGIGQDTVRGGEGDDMLFGDCSGEFHFSAFVCGIPSEIVEDADVIIGDGGTDTTGYTTYDDDSGDHTVDVNVTLDGAANDGREGENDNVDVENLYVFGDYDEADTGVATVVGDGKANSITTHAIGEDEASGNDVVTPAGGNDVVSTGYGTDTVNAVDGFADYIDCGEGPFDDVDTATDVANVDQFDTTVNCETVNVTQVGELASENNPPSISWVTPAADGGDLANGTVLEVSASDSDDGINRVIFLAGTRVLCTVTAAPYRCTYTKTDADVGKATIVAIAIDNAQQTATALRFLDVDRFAGARLSSRVSPKRDTSDPRRFRVRGKLTLPAGVSAAEGCQGSVVVRFKAGKKTISTKRAKLRDDCSYSVKRKFTLPERFDGANKLRVFARFAGNDVLAPDAAKRKKVTING